MKNICVGMTLLLFVLFSSACVVSQQGNIQTSTNNYPENTQSGQSKKEVDKTANQEDGKAEYKLGEQYFDGKDVPQDYTKAAEWYQKAAEIGNPNAQYKLGRMYQGYGDEGVPTDIKEAFKWYHIAAKQGLADAQDYLGLMYYNGIGVPQDYAEAAKWFRKAAEQGNVDSQFYLGAIYGYGQGVPQDYTEAAEWYRKAAEQGAAEAQCNLGFFYEEGKGVPQDDKEAIKWYRKAAERGHARAQLNIGSMYHQGQGVPQDYTEAVKWYRKAAEQGNDIAQFDLGYMYYYGKGVPKDYTKAAEWYRKAAEQGDADAQLYLGQMYYNGKGVPKDYAKAAEWFRKAAEQGLVDAQSMLGLMYCYGIGIPQDYTEAAKWYRKAAEQGDPNAQSMLGLMYYYGHGVTQDYTEAVKLNRKAAEQGLVDAQSRLGLMYYIGIGIPQDYTEAAKWCRKAAEQGDASARFLLGKLLEKTDYPGWECLNTTDTEYTFINRNKIRQQGNLVWYWLMRVPFQESDSGKKCTKECWVADCDSTRRGLVSYIKYDSNGKIIHSHTFKKPEMDMSPVVPGSIGESRLEYACSHAKAGDHQKREAAKKGACFGTGWPVAAGFVVTNNHVVEGRNHITLIRQDGVKIPASVAAHDAFNDLALLEVENTGLLPAALPLSSRPAVLGEKIVTVGYPHPDLLGVKPKLTEGVVNSTSGLGDDPRALQISVPIQAGNSGGPLVNMEGKVVGIVTSKVDAVKMFKWTNDLPQNINYGIKISYLKGLLSSVSQKQRIDTVAPFKYISVEELAKKIKNSVLMIVAK